MANNDVKIKVSLDGAEDVTKGLNGIGDGASKADSKLGTMVGGGLKGAGVAVTAFAAASIAAGAALVVGVVGAYAEYEQNIGGIETLFKGAAGKMEGYANDAYKTAGLSANEYMSQVTSFSAALIAGVGGDTDKAADIANRAIIDMSDNAAKFGSDIGSIQNAYQGFAKQNYSMLDNLKLGFGGTASEMARLVNESGAMGDSFTATATNLNEVSYDKIIESIGIVQDKMGITGTTAKEASETISGSIDTMRGAWTNLLTGLGDADADVATLAGNVVASFQQVVTNIVPVIESIGSNIEKLGPQLGSMGETVVGAIGAALPAVISAGVALVGGLLQGIVGALPALLPALLPAIVGLVETVATLGPQLIVAGADAVVSLATGIGEALPTLIPAVITGLLAMVQALIEAAPMLVDAGVQLLMGLATGIIDSIPVIIEALPAIVDGIVNFITTSVPMLLEAGIALFNGLLEALPTTIDALVAALPAIITAIITAITSAIPMLVQAGISLLTSLVTALPEIITSIVAALPEIISSILKAVLGAIPLLIESGIELFIALIGALPEIITTIITAIPQIIGGLIKALTNSIPALIMAGVQLLVALVSNMPAIIGGILKAIPQIIIALIGAIAEAGPQLVTAGVNLVKGLWEGISDATGWLMGKISGFVDNVMGGIKDFFGINSPSRRMKMEVGVQLPAGVGGGVEENADAALKPIQDMNSRIMDEAGKLSTDVAFTHDTKLTQSMVPMQATPQFASRSKVEATLDPYLISGAIADAFASQDQGQDKAAVYLSKDSISTLATAIVDSMRVQSRQGGLTHV